MKVTKVYEVGDVFDNFGDKEILVWIEDDKYTIRICYPDGIEHYTVNKKYLDKLKYVETIELK
ncbi:hypothetical protein [Clostridium rectalis]|uniref:hypothetical protein n=1 Tax=Clostridium rectalis TaxID=2040295 RepID=UPI000F641528|nr:hypothetical protein [Clostridium rectalis]